MIKKLFLPCILLILTYGFWISPNFKEIAAGVAIFLFGMIALEEGFTAFTGGTLEKILKNSTDKQWKSVSFGVIATTIMQSSSLVSVITISFLSTGLLGLAAGIGIIFGANIGTTTGAWLIAGLGLKVKISAYAMPMLVFGIIMVMQKRKEVKGIGYILAGLGFLFLGISYMKSGFDAFKDTLDLAEFAMSGFMGLFLYSLIGIAATVIMQSSHATMVLIITALSAGQITYENSLALAIGANVGTTITAILGAMSAATPGKRLAAAHLIFNVTTGLVAIIFLQQFLVAVDYSSNFLGIADNDYTLKLAIFHTLFNTAGVVIMWPFIQKLVTLLERTFVDDAPPKKGAIHLHKVNNEFPETAVEAIRMETQHAYDVCSDILIKGLSLNKEQVFNSSNLETTIKESRTVIAVDFETIYENNIKTIYSDIIDFISKVSFTWELEQSSKIHWLRNANQNLITAVKAMKHLRKNMSVAIVSRNSYLKEQYDILRFSVAKLLRKINVIKDMAESEHYTEDVHQILEDIKKFTTLLDEKVNTHIVALLKEDKITAEMATSLFNDSQYVKQITENLMSMTTTLYQYHSAEKKVDTTDAEMF